MKYESRFIEMAAALVAGLVFGAGLIISGMVEPRKVIGFLDVGGSWDPSLALVMAAAVGVGLLGFGFSTRRARSVLGLPMRFPSNRAIDRRLLVGAAAFGVGWGLAGLCPGPALVALATGSGKALLFVAAMLGGMGIFEFMNGRGAEK
jgi:uncharacterized membrane protein YedE/YeeE